MQFRKCTSEPPQILDPGSCQAVRIFTTLDKPEAMLSMSREESEAKQRAYERQREEWRELHPERN